MLVRYKRNKKPACYDTDSLAPGGGLKPDPRPSGPFASCGTCPYASHGFVCHSAEGDCIRSDLRKLDEKRKKEART